MKHIEWLQEKLSTVSTQSVSDYKGMLEHVGFWKLEEEFKALIFKYYEGYADDPRVTKDDDIRFAWSLQDAFSELSSKME